MRISDWISDVCSSDLRLRGGDHAKHVGIEGFARGVARLLRRLELRVVAEDAGVVDEDVELAVLARDFLGGGDRRSVVMGKSVSLRVDIGGRRIINKKYVIEYANTNNIQK